MPLLYFIEEKPIANKITIIVLFVYEILVFYSYSFCFNNKLSQFFRKLKCLFSSNIQFSKNDFSSGIKHI